VDRARSGAAVSSGETAGEIRIVIADDRPGHPRCRQRPVVPDAGVQATVLEAEGDILMLIAQGLSNSEIAAALILSANTVKTHVNRVFFAKKTGGGG
jgi:hypothetical protein